MEGTLVSDIRVFLSSTLHVVIREQRGGKTLLKSKVGKESEFCEGETIS